jgi:hypothetical protein
MELRNFFFSLFLSSVSSIAAFVSGNPSQPSLTCQSIFKEHNDKFAIRLAFLDDYVYAQHLRGEFDVPGSLEKPPVVKMSTEAGVLTFNFQQRIDLYGILGSCRLQLDQEIFGRRQFAWGVGIKSIIVQFDCFRIGCDLKYFTSTQDPLYLVSSGVPLNVVSDLDLKYREYQAALGLAYQNGIFCPYILGTYLRSKIDPNTHHFLVRVPGMDELIEPSIRSFVSATSWGMAVGATLVMGEKGIFSVESRFINQNGIDASLEIRF